MAVARGNQRGPFDQVDVGEARTRKEVGATSSRETNAPIGVDGQSGEKCASGATRISESIPEIQESERAFGDLVGAWKAAAVAECSSEDGSHDRRIRDQECRIEQEQFSPAKGVSGLRQVLQASIRGWPR